MRVESGQSKSGKSVANESSFFAETENLKNKFYIQGTVIKEGSGDFSSESSPQKAAEDVARKLGIINKHDFNLFVSTAKIMTAEEKGAEDKEFKRINEKRGRGSIKGEKSGEQLDFKFP